MAVEQKLRDPTKLFTNLHSIIKQPVVVLPHPSGDAAAVNTKGIISLGMSPGVSGCLKDTWLGAGLIRQSP